MQRLRLPGGGRGGGHGGPVKEYSKGTLDLSVMFSFFNKDDAAACNLFTSPNEVVLLCGYNFKNIF